MTSVSVIELPLLAHSLLLLTAAASWRLEGRKRSQLSRPRLLSFRGGLVLSVIGVLVTASCWIDPYPLAQTPDSGLSTAWLYRAWTVAFIAPLVSIILALFGRGWSRIMLALSGGLSLRLAFGSLLQNGV